MIGVLLFLAAALMVLLTKLFGLLGHRPMVHHAIDWGDFLSAICCAYGVWLCFHEDKFRERFPYGVAGYCLWTASILMPIAADWVKVSAETQNLLVPILMVIDIVGSGLILFEGIRWFRAQVKLVERRAE